MTDNINTSKYVVYAVEVDDPVTRASKVVTYAVEDEVFGSLYQDDAGKKPVYREAPTGGIPYVDMSATSAELKINVVAAGTYTFIIYNADETFTIIEDELTAGENVAPITEDFNQCVVIKRKEKNIHRYAINSIKEGMKARAS